MFELLFGHLYVYFIKYSPLFGEAKTADDCCRCTRTPAQASPTPAPSRASFIIAVAATGVAGEAHNALILRHLLLRNLLVLRPIILDASASETSSSDASSSAASSQGPSSGS